MEKPKAKTIEELDQVALIGTAQGLFDEVQRIVKIEEMDEMTPQNLNALRMLLGYQNGFHRAVQTRIGVVKLTVTPLKINAAEKYSERLSN